MGLCPAPGACGGRCGAPALVAFSGKRQWVELLNTGRPRAQWVKTVPLGPQSLRPQVRAQGPAVPVQAVPLQAGPCCQH